MNTTDVAIIGMVGRFPGAADIEAFWRNLVAGRESIVFFTDEELAAAGEDVATLRKNPNFVAARGLLPGVELFDAPFFGFNAKEAEVTDPQQRLFLEASMEALEHAGYHPEKYPGAIGVYAGMGSATYFLNHILPRSELIDLVGPRGISLGNEKDYLAMRVAYKLDLHGPALSINTACSTGLVTVCQACQGLMAYQCDLALAGGVTVTFPQRGGYFYQEHGILSRDGHCRPFDENSAGTVFSDGVGVVVLKRLPEALRDGDQIYAVIKGVGLNNDGADKVGFTAPSVDGQAEAIAIAHADAGFDPGSISYVECHGTATPIGDPIEIAALTQAFGAGTQRRHFCAIGSVKSNIGHLGAAAGTAGLIKTVLSLHHQQLPASLHFQKPNPKIDFENSPFFVNSKLADWPAGSSPRRAGVSSFGLGGTNAHVVLEEAPSLPPSGPSRPVQLLLLSGKTAPALEAATLNLLAHLKANPGLNLADVAYTLQVGRGDFAHRRMLVCRDLEDAVQALESRDPKRLLSGQLGSELPVLAFMLSGQGAQYVGMGAGLYQAEPVFKEQVDLCAGILRSPLGLDLREVLFPPLEKVAEAGELLLQTRLTQPALFVFEYALAKLWESWGIMPSAMIGHSLGEIVAACLAGVFSLEDALAFVARRSQLVQEQPAGAMLAVRLPESELQPLLSGELTMAAVNSPALSVVAGPFGAIELLEARLKEQGVPARRLHTSHAFHSAMMDPVLEPLGAFLRNLRLEQPSVRFISDVTGRWIQEQSATDFKYWVSHVRRAVRFADGLTEIYQQAAHQILLEVGPGQMLAPLANQHPAKGAGHVVLSSFAAIKDQEQTAMLSALGRMWLAGQPVNWDGFYQHEKRRRIPLPTYPFQRERYWVEPKRVASAQSPDVVVPSKNTDVADWFYLASWKRSAPVQPWQVPARKQTWLVFLDEVGLGASVAERLEQSSQLVVRVRAGTRFEMAPDGVFSLNPSSCGDYGTLICELRRQQKLPQSIGHFWGVTADNSATESQAEAFRRHRRLGFDSLLYLAQSLSKLGLDEVVKINLISNQVQEVADGETPCPGKAMVLGLAKVVSQEHRNIICRSVDVVLEGSGTAGRQRLVGQLVTELLSGETEPVIAYRGRHRWVQSFEQTRLAETLESKTKLKERGVYLITGGFGQIGLLLAENLARNHRARLILMGRSVLPPREEWAAWSERRGPEDPISQKIQKVKELEALGGEVMVLAANVANKEQVGAGIADAYERFGEINGVFHAAGIVGRKNFKFVAETSVVDCELHFEPKVYGLLVLEEAIKGRSLDFVVLLSSLSTILGGLGFAAYSAANQFMDAFALRHGHGGGTPWISVNWDGWMNDQTEGLATADTSVGKLRMNAAEGITAFRRILGQTECRQVIVSTGDLNRRLDLWVRTQPVEHEASSKSGEATIAHKRPEVQTKFVPVQNETERVIANIWEALLGIEKVGVDDNFFDLGGDSLLLLRVQVKIHEALGVNLSAAELFQYPTIRLLAQRFSDPTPEKSGLGAVQDRGQMQRAALTRQPRSNKPV